MAAADKGELISQLRERMKDVAPLVDEATFFTDTQTLARFLKARDWNLPDAEKLLRASVEWRRTTRPLHADCMWCHEQPGYHGIRQVGFDESGRPVIYACFAQATARHTTVEDTIAHSVYLVENALKTMSAGANTWVFIIDCTGMTLQACNPRIGYGVTQILADNYPELLGMVFCINHSPIFQSVWSAIKVFLHANTVEKMHLIRSKKKIRAEFDKHFGEELTGWLLEEIRLNKIKPIAAEQKEFWHAPTNVTETASSIQEHDPRGCPSYVARYIDRYFDNLSGVPYVPMGGGAVKPSTAKISTSKKTPSSSAADTSRPPATKSMNLSLSVHHPHPNIIDALSGVLRRQKSPESLSPKQNNDASHNSVHKTPRKDATMGKTDNGFHEDSSSDDEDLAQDIKAIDIGDEYQVEKDKVSSVKM